MTDSDQPRHFSPRTHDLTLGELRRMIASCENVPDSFIVRCKNSNPLQVFERVQEIHGVVVFNTTGNINLPID